MRSFDASAKRLQHARNFGEEPFSKMVGGAHPTRLSEVGIGRRTKLTYVFSVLVAPEGRPDRSPAHSAGMGDALSVSSPAGTTEASIVPPGLGCT